MAAMEARSVRSNFYDSARSLDYIVQCTYTKDMTEPLLIRIDLASPVPAYRQIADGLRALLVNGAVEPNTTLPTVREIAMDLGVHHNTVAEAYRTLAAEGWLELTRGRGARVLPRTTPAPSAKSRERFLGRLRALIAEARAAGVPVDALAGEMRRALKA